MKVLITGSQGQVGRELCLRAEVLGWDYLGLTRQDLDITNAQAVKQVVYDYMPDAVINAAAYTAVDKAETDRNAAFAINRDGVANLARVCADLFIPLVHYSTDYVFDGSQEAAYVETDDVRPLGVYGESKLAGEQAIQDICEKDLIFRTSWEFSEHGHNFVKTMLRLGAERDALGVYHLAQLNAVSWYGFAEAIFVEARNMRRLSAK